jgi:hypothetical protein
VEAKEDAGFALTIERGSGNGFAGGVFYRDNGTDFLPGEEGGCRQVEGEL